MNGATPAGRETPALASIAPFVPTKLASKHWAKNLELRDSGSTIWLEAPARNPNLMTLAGLRVFLSTEPRPFK